MLYPELVAYIRRWRPEFSDAQIRSHLIAQGLAETDINQAFLAAGPAAPVAPPPAAKKKSLAIWSAAVAIPAAILCALFIAHEYGRGQKALTAEQTRIQAELAAYQPPLYQEPASVADYLPQGQVPGNAGLDYFQAISLLTASTLPATDIPALFKLDADEARYGPAIALLESGVKKKDCRITGALWTPRSELEVLRGVTALVAFAWLGRVFNHRAAAYLKQGRPGPAEQEARKEIALGYHLMQDWNTVAQCLGVTRATRGALRLGMVFHAQGRGGPQEGLRLGKFILQLAAYSPQPKELEKIMALAADPQKLSSLKDYLDNPLLRRPYCEFVLMTASSWGPAESALGQPSQARQEFFAYASRHDDPRVAALAKGYAAILSEVQKPVAGVSPQGRATLGMRLFAVLGQLPAL
jgi:hypothetical protein